MKKLAALLAIPLLLAQQPVIAQNNLLVVVSVGDGDTVRLTRQGQTLTVRLACIDAPETAQSPWGKQSADRLKQLLPVGKAVQLRAVELDRYGRTVGELFLGSQSINLQMVKEGQAVVYRQYLETCSATQSQYLQAEAQAKSKKLGFWNQAKPVMPWDFRRGATSTAVPAPQPVRLPTSNCSPAYPDPDLCIPISSPDLDCKDIGARNFRVLPPDPHRLDGDRDGVGCES